MNLSRRNDINFQIILVVIFTAFGVAVVDNVIDTIRAEEETRQRQENVAKLQAGQNNITNTILDKLTFGVDRQDELISKLDAILNNTQQQQQGNNS